MGHTSKKENSCTLRQLLEKFFEELTGYAEHKKMIKHQDENIKTLKENLKSDEILLHVDFSENYNTKYREEIQSFHFGGSRKQISIHTGVLYYLKDKEVEKQSFATCSSNIDHHSHAITAHLVPIFELAKRKVANIKTLHFLSDGPTSQYRNQFNLGLMKVMLPKYFPYLAKWVWNYSVAGHGKGRSHACIF